MKLKKSFDFLKKLFLVQKLIHECIKYGSEWDLKSVSNSLFAWGLFNSIISDCNIISAVHFALQLTSVPVRYVEYQRGLLY